MRFATHQPLRGAADRGVELRYLIVPTRAPYGDYRIRWHGRALVAREISALAFERNVQARVTLMLRKIATSLFAHGRVTHDRDSAGMALAFVAAAQRIRQMYRWPAGLFRRGEPSWSVRNERRLVSLWRRFAKNTGIDASRAFELLPTRLFSATNGAKRSVPPAVMVMHMPTRVTLVSWRMPAYSRFFPREGGSAWQRPSVLTLSLAPTGNQERPKQIRRRLAPGPVETALEVVVTRQAMTVLQQRHRLDGGVAPKPGLSRFPFALAPADRTHATRHAPMMVLVHSLVQAVPRTLSSASIFPWRSISESVHVRMAWPSPRGVGENRRGRVPIARWREQARHAVTSVLRMPPPPAHPPISPHSAIQKGLPAVTLAYREALPPPELHLSKHVQRIEQHITRKIVQDIAQATPWRGELEKAVLTPRVVRELAEQVTGLMTQRIGLERYRRGL